MPAVEYSQPPALNIGEKPGAGSVRVPANVPVEVSVPRSSMAEALPVDALKMRSAKPSVRRTEPLSGRTTVVSGY